MIFFPLNGEPAIATARETTQPTLTALTEWAARLPPVYVDGALDRALTLAKDGSVSAQLQRSDYDARADAKQMESSAGLERTAAEIGRGDAQQLGQKHFTPQEAFSATTEAPRLARAEEAADGERRTRSAEAKATSHSPGRRSGKKK